jgi:hypothetical protein
MKNGISVLFFTFRGMEAGPLFRGENCVAKGKMVKIQ